MFQLGDHAGLVERREDDKSDIALPLEDAFLVPRDDGKFNFKVGYGRGCLVDDCPDDRTAGLLLSAASQNACRGHNGLRRAQKRKRQQTRSR
jgi:hypothetical protein